MQIKYHISEDRTVIETSREQFTGTVPANYAYLDKKHPNPNLTLNISGYEGVFNFN